MSDQHQEKKKKKKEGVEIIKLPPMKYDFRAMGHMITSFVIIAAFIGFVCGRRSMRNSCYTEIKAKNNLERVWTNAYSEGVEAGIYFKEMPGQFDDIKWKRHTDSLRTNHNF